MSWGTKKIQIFPRFQNPKMYSQIIVKDTASNAGSRTDKNADSRLFENGSL